MKMRGQALPLMILAVLAAALSGCGGGGGGLELQGTCYLLAPSNGTNELRSLRVAADGTITEADTEILNLPKLVAATTDGCVYASYYDSGTTEYRIAAFSVDASSGALSPLGIAVELAGQPYGMVVDPQERFIYVTTISNTLSRGIGKYGIKSDGSLEAGISLTVTYDLRGLAVSRDGYNLYVPSLDGPSPYKVMAYRINQTTGELTANGYANVTGQPWYDVASPVADRIYVGTTGSQVAAFDVGPIDGTLTALTNSPFSGANLTPNPLAVQPNGTHLLASTVTDPALDYVLEEFTIAADGSVSSTRSISVDGKSVSSAVFHPSGQAVFLACNCTGAGANLYSYRFNADGSMSLIASYDAGDTLWGIAAVVFNP